MLVGMFVVDQSSGRLSSLHRFEQTLSIDSKTACQCHFKEKLYCVAEKKMFKGTVSISNFLAKGKQQSVNVHDMTPYT